MPVEDVRDHVATDGSLLGVQAGEAEHVAFLTDCYGKQQEGG